MVPTAPTPAFGPADAPWWIDGHLDLAYLDQVGPRIAQEAPDRAVRGISLPALARGRVRIFLGTIFTELGEEAAAQPWGYRDHDDLEGAHAAGARQLAIYHGLERAGALRIVRTRADLEACAGAAPDAPPGLVILMEGADPIRTPEEAGWWFERGVRVVGMTWARGSRYAGGNGTGGPLTAMGRALAQHFDALGILHDASHLSRAAFDGLCAATARRIVATHSNAQALLDPSERHLTDAQACAIAVRDGVIGLALYQKFLASGRPSTVEDALAHVGHYATLVGRDRLVLGSDFDGGFTPAEAPTGCQRPEELGSLAQGLARRGWSAGEIAGFAHGNWMRVLRAALPERAPTTAA
ncbi:MAG: membrane dipeptidase [Phycisphaerales bacterium]